ncbi:MAG TPA: N-acetyltransferase [Oscillospiraceae bacterium]|nr:N-acetyltransferase [Oscillospiraceae bacterium]
MELRKLTRGGIAEVYHTHLRADFPADERKPLPHILRAWDRGGYNVFGLYERDALRAYAFVGLPEKPDCVFLDYFAVLRGLRGRGTGARALYGLRERFRDRTAIVLEAERPDAAPDAAARALRERRIRFYLRCGARRSGARSRVHGVPYQILTLPCAGLCDDETARRTLRVFYRDVSPEAYAAGDVCIG